MAKFEWGDNTILLSEIHQHMRAIYADRQKAVAMGVNLANLGSGAEEIYRAMERDGGALGVSVIYDTEERLWPARPEGQPQRKAERISAEPTSDRLHDMQERLAQRTQLFEAQTAALRAEIAGARDALADLRATVTRTIADVQTKLDVIAEDMRALAEDLRDDGGDRDR